MLEQLERIQQKIIPLPASNKTTSQALNRAYDSVKAAITSLNEAQQSERGQ